jgi:hypothetical protein
VFPLALRSLMDGGLVSGDMSTNGKDQQLLNAQSFSSCLRCCGPGHFQPGVLRQLAGERVTAVRNWASHVLRQEIQSFETTADR